MSGITESRNMSGVHQGPAGGHGFDSTSQASPTGVAPEGNPSLDLKQVAQAAGGKVDFCRILESPRGNDMVRLNP